MTLPHFELRITIHAPSLETSWVSVYIYIYILIHILRISVPWFRQILLSCLIPTIITTKYNRGSMLRRLRTCRIWRWQELNHCPFVMLVVAVAILLLLSSLAYSASSSSSSRPLSSLIFTENFSTSQHNDSNFTSPNRREAVNRQQLMLRRTHHRHLLAGGGCTMRDLSISQSRSSNVNGIPEFIVQVINTCLSGCAPSNIHLTCGWFASTQLVDPNIFRRLAYNDCLLNGGRPLQRGGIVRFTYRNSFMYSLSIKSAKFC